MQRLAILLTLGLALPAQAHMVWLERDGPAVRAYFGEWDADVREKTGGRLDSIATPHLLKDGGKAPGRESDHIRFDNVPQGDVRLVEAGLKPRGQKEDDRTKTIFLARHGRSEASAALELELVPVTPGGNAVTLFFRGKPLPKTVVKVVGPPKWEKVYRTDDQGRIGIETPWSGQYVIEAAHVDPTPGGSGDDAFARTRYVYAHTITAAKGLK
jgi:hypothetical protein